MIDIPVEKLAFWNEETNAWEVEKGKYNIFVGTASDNIAETIGISID